MERPRRAAAAAATVKLSAAAAAEAAEDDALLVDDEAAHSRKRARIAPAALPPPPATDDELIESLPRPALERLLKNAVAAKKITRAELDEQNAAAKARACALPPARSRYLPFSPLPSRCRRRSPNSHASVYCRCRTCQSGSWRLSWV